MADPSRDSRAGDERRAATAAEEAQFYREFSWQLVSLVRRRVNTSPDIVEDACAFAWMQFVRYQPDRKRSWRGWLVTVAEREAWSLHAAEAGRVPLGVDLDDDEARVPEPAGTLNPADDYMDARAALAVLAQVPERRRKAKALHVLGYTHAEVGAMLGVGRTRASHLIREATESLREIQAEKSEPEAVNARAARLNELEKSPPSWLTKSIGTPGSPDKATRRLAWRRAALAIDDYRALYGATLGDELLDHRPMEPAAARAFDLARRSVQRVRELEGPCLER